MSHGPDAFVELPGWTFAEKDALIAAVDYDRVKVAVETEFDAISLAAATQEDLDVACAAFMRQLTAEGASNYALTDGDGVDIRRVR